MRDLKFLTVCARYMETYSGIFAASTIGEVERRLRRIAAVVCRTHLTCEDPARWSSEDVVLIISGLRSEYDIGPGSLRHLISDLNRLCLFRGNNSVQIARVRYPSAFPRHEGGHIGGLSAEDRAKLLSYFETLPGDKIRDAAASIMALASGGRCMEISNLRVRDVDLESGTVTYRVVKGLGTYGHVRTVPILPDCMHLVERVISGKDDCSQLVIANSVTGEILTTNSLRRMRQRTETSSGVRFEYRTLRRAYADSLRSMGLSIDAVSMFLGHHSSDTTELYYCRLTESAALEEFANLVQYDNQTSRSGYNGMVHPPGFEPGQQAWKA